MGALAGEARRRDPWLREVEEWRAASFRRRVAITWGQAVLFVLLVALSVFVVFRLFTAPPDSFGVTQFVAVTSSSVFDDQNSVPAASEIEVLPPGNLKSHSYSTRRVLDTFRAEESKFDDSPLVTWEPELPKPPKIMEQLRIPEESGPAYRKAFHSIGSWTPPSDTANASAADELPNRTEPWEIVFLRTSTEPLEQFELCALYSAAKFNPSAAVKLLSFETFRLPEYFKTVPKVSSVALNFTDLFEGTPLEGWYRERLFENATNFVSRVRHLANAARHAYVWKHGATYLDTDIITLKPLDRLRNCLAFQKKENRLNSSMAWKAANGALLAFDQKHPFMELVMNTTRKTFNASLTEGNWGPKLLTRMLPVYESLREKNGWPPVHVLPSELVYPVLYQSQRAIFSRIGKKPKIEDKINNAYTLHMWRNAERKKFGNGALMSRYGSVLHSIIRRKCPPLSSSFVKRSRG